MDMPGLTIDYSDDESDDEEPEYEDEEPEYEHEEPNGAADTEDFTSDLCASVFQSISSYTEFYDALLDDVMLPCMCNFFAFFQKI